MLRVVVILSIMLSCFSCSSSNEHADLRAFVNEEKAKPPGRIEPIPTYPPYESYVYSATSIRSPFDKPIDIQRRVFAKATSDVRPNFNRAKEYLEGFDVSVLKMVGTLEKGGTLWALILDGNGDINPVVSGNFMGKNHGKVVSVENTKIELIEIVSDGLEGWVERPRLLALVEKE